MRSGLPWSVSPENLTLSVKPATLSHLPATPLSRCHFAEQMEDVMKALLLALAALFGWAASSPQVHWLAALLLGHSQVQPMAPGGPGTATDGNGNSYEDD